MSTMLLLILFVGVIAFIVTATTEYEERSWEEAYELARRLVSQMTIDEQVGIVTGIAEYVVPCAGNTHSTAQFPSLCLHDGPLGVRDTKGASAFPAGINAAASFDRSLMRRRAVALGQEFRDKGVNVLLGPAVDIMRAPEWGRGWESFGEDPFLSGVAAFETIKGIQSQGVISCVKHFIAYTQETQRHQYSAILDDRVLHEVYAWPFARAMEADVASVMCAYNKINGTFTCEDESMLSTILRNEFKFKGFVVSDWHATHDTVQAANNGLDMDMPGGDGTFGSALKAAVTSNQVTKERLSEMVERIVATWYKFRQDVDYPSVKLNGFLGLMDPGYDVQRDHKTIIREMGAASVVLLKNQDDILPIRSHRVKEIAIVGSDAGNNLLDHICPAHYCPLGTMSEGGGSGAGSNPYLVTPLEGITTRAKQDSIKVTFFLNDAGPLSDILGSIIDTTHHADMAVVFSSVYAAERFDLHDLKPNELGDRLIKHVADNNANTVVVVHSGNPVLMDWIDHPNVKAVVWAGYPGQETGNSLADVLFGDVNPSGRLPYTIAKRVSDYPAHVSKALEIPYTEGLLTGYKWFDAKNIDPLFEFGFGLSYTRFSYQDFRVNLNKDKTVTASITIHNNGDMAGAEIVQLYLAFPVTAAGEPQKLLRGFDKVLLERNESKQVSFTLTETELSIWDVETKTWTVPVGEYTLHVGASSRDIRQSRYFTLHS